MIVSGANLVVTLPDHLKVVRAFRSVDLLVSIELYMTSTAKLSHYILPPRPIYERPDVPMIALERVLYPQPFTQYMPAPAGSDLVDDWYVFCARATLLGLALRFADKELPKGEAPISEALIAMLMANLIVPFEEIARTPACAMFPVPQAVAAPPDPASRGRFEVAPFDIAALD